MAIKYIRFLLCLSMMTFPYSIFAGADEFKQYVLAEQDAYIKGKYEDAEQNVFKAIKEIDAIRKTDTISSDQLYFDEAEANQFYFLGLIYLKQQQYDKAENVLMQSKNIYEQKLGAKNKGIANVIFLLGFSYFQQNTYDEAEQLFKRTVELYKKFPDIKESQEKLSDSLSFLGRIYALRGMNKKAEKFLLQSIKSYKKLPNFPTNNYFKSSNSLSSLYMNEGHYDKAELIINNALKVAVQTKGMEIEISQLLTGLASIYKIHHRYVEVEKILTDNLQLTKVQQEPYQTILTATILNALLQVYNEQGNFEKSKSITDNIEKTCKKFALIEGQNFKSSFNLICATADTNSSTNLVVKSFEFLRNQYGSQSPLTINSLSALAFSNIQEGNLSQAEIFAKQGLEFFSKPANSIYVVPKIQNLAALTALYVKKKEQLKATEYSRGAVKTIQNSFFMANSSKSDNVQWTPFFRDYFLLHVSLLAQLSAIQPERGGELHAESFAVSQLAHYSKNSQVIKQMTARLASNDVKTSEHIRDWQNTIAYRYELEKQLLDSFASANINEQTELRQHIQDTIKLTDDKITQGEQWLKKNFPAYSSFINPEPSSLKDAQALLADDEALLSYLISDNANFLYVVRRDKAQWFKLNTNKKELQQDVDQLRRSLDIAELDQQSRMQIEQGDFSKLLPFRLDVADRLYKAVFAQAEPMLSGVKHILVVPDGALNTIPLGILVSKEPDKAYYDSAKELDRYKTVSWLASQYDFTVLPTVNSLRLLRQSIHSSTATQPLLGFGDPVLPTVPNTVNRMVTAQAIFRGVHADSQKLRDNFSRLPETADELKALAHLLDAPEDSLFLQQQATETKVKALNKQKRLADARIIAFSTHGLTAEETQQKFQGLYEAGLVLTPPPTGKETDNDDGLLTASEVAQLNLNADWIVLSACNTGTPPESESTFSQLADAFIFAGGRSLLASQWQVHSKISQTIITGTFEYLKNQPQLRRSEALQKTMLDLINHVPCSDQDQVCRVRNWLDRYLPFVAVRNPYSHPIFWSPFVVIGEGGSIQK